MSSQLTRLLCVVTILALTTKCSSGLPDSDVTRSISFRRSLLDTQSAVNKAEEADCRAVKHLPEGQDMCKFVTENCAGGV